jgi:hypothetical protein
LLRSRNPTDASTVPLRAGFHHTAHCRAGQEIKMKALYILVPLLAALGGCSYYNTPPVAAVTPTYVTPPNTVVLGAPGTTTAPSTVIVQPNR